MAVFLLLLSCASLVTGVPSVSFPINSQVPPVARVSEAFGFKFSPWTFTSSFQPISYNITSGPSWLMLDSNSRNLYGMPTQDDVGAFEVVITATDSTGSTAHEATLVVSSEPGPVIGRGINSQLKNIGVRNGRGGIVFFPGQPYEFSFTEDTFGPAGLVKQYEAVSTGNTPLPSWINFDQGRLKFSGVTPDLTSLIAPPQTFDVTLIASDYPGFAGSSVSFQMVVGPHRIYFKDTILTTNATFGSAFNYSLPRDAILLDSGPIGSENLSSLSVTGSDWLSFNKENFVLSGTPPQGVESTVVDLVARDIFGGEAQAKLQISISSVDTAATIFTTEIPDFNITSGERFVYSLNRTSLSIKDIKLSVEYNPVVDWINFDAANLQFQGEAPSNSLSVEVAISAQSPGRLSDSRNFKLFVGGDNIKSFSAIPTRTSTGITMSHTAKKTGAGTALPTRAGPPQTTDSTGQTDTSTEAIVKRSRKRTLIIVLATVLPLIVVCSFLFIWYVISRQNDIESTSYYSRSATPVGLDISRPFEQLPQPWAVASNGPKDLATPRRLSAFGYFTTDGSGRISNGFMSSMMSNDGTILRLGTPPTPPTHSGLLPPAPEMTGDRSSVGPINFSQHPVNRTSFITGPTYSLYPAVSNSDPRGANAHHVVSQSNSQGGDTSHPAHQRTNSRGSNSRPRRLGCRPHRRHSSMSISATAASRRSGVGHGRPSFGGPPGYGIPKRSWRTAISPSCWVGGRRFRESEDTFETVSTEIFNQISQISQVNDLGQPSVRLVDGSPEGAEKASHTRARGSSPFFAGPATAWRRESKIYTVPGVEIHGGDQSSLIDDVIKTMTRENSHTKTIGTYSSLNLPETPVRRYNSALPSHFATSSSFVNYPPTSVVTEEDGAFSHVIDESGQRVWYPNHSRESGITAYSRGGSSYYPYEPFEYGVAVTSARAQGTVAGGPSIEREHPTRVVEASGEVVIPPLRQRAKLVDFTKKRPVSISEEGGEEETKGSFPADMAYL